MKFFVFGRICIAPNFHLLGRHSLHVFPSRRVEVVGHRLAIELLGQVEEQVKIHVHVPVDFQFLKLSRLGVVGPAVKKRFWFRDLDIIVQVQVPWSGHPIAVRRLVLHHQHKRLFRVPAFLKPLDREIGNNVSAIALDPFCSFGRYHVRVVVQSLTGKDFPVVESLRRSFKM